LASCLEPAEPDGSMRNRLIPRKPMWCAPAVVAFVALMSEPALAAARSSRLQESVTRWTAFGRDVPALAIRLADGGERGISVQPVSPHSDIEILPPPAKIAPPPAKIVPPPESHEPKATSDEGHDPTVRLASSDGQNGRLIGLSAKAPYTLVDLKANPDAVWNPLTREVMTDGVVSAHNVGRDDLSGIIDRIAVLHWIEARAKSTRQSVRILPDQRTHKKDSIVEIQLDGLAHRWLILINLAGDGTLQVLYPRGTDPPLREDPQFRVQLQVGDPLGADEIVAVSSVQPMAALQDAVHRLDSSRDPTRLKEAIETLGPVDLLLGSAGLLTTP
jgi:hypothetical protein